MDVHRVENNFFSSSFSHFVESPLTFNLIYEMDFKSREKSK